MTRPYALCMFMQAFHGVDRELHGVRISMDRSELVTRAEAEIDRHAKA